MFWPLYRESLLQGPSHVSLAIPGIPSDISKSVGGTSPALLLIPNIDYLKSFVNGNIGIADTLIRGMIHSVINQDVIVTDAGFLESYVDALGMELPNLEDYKKEIRKLKKDAEQIRAELAKTKVDLSVNINTPKVDVAKAGVSVGAGKDVNANLSIGGKSTTIGSGGKSTSSTGGSVGVSAGGSVGGSVSANAPKVSVTPPDISTKPQMTFPDIKDIPLKIPKIKIPLDEITVPDIFKDCGIKALEKSILLSMFETHKPFIEIVKLVLNNIVLIEDIIARVMPLLSTNPLTSKSEKPIVNGGATGRTKAIGFQKGKEFKQALNNLEKLSKSGTEVEIDRDGNVNRKKRPTKPAKTDQPKLSDLTDMTKKWNVESTVYSTGIFDPAVDYLYSYVYLPEDETLEEEPFTPTEEPPINPYDKYKPEKIILGVFRHNGIPMNPKEKLKTITTSGISVSEQETPFNVADWVYKSPKWMFRGEDYIWPSFGGSSGEPVYLWVDKIGLTRESKTSPGDNWKIKKYKEGDKNLINKDIDAIPDDPYIVKFDKADRREYASYFSDFINTKTKTNKDLTFVDKLKINVDIMSKIDIPSHLQNVFLYGSGSKSVYVPDIPGALKKAFKPYQIYVPAAAQDEELDGSGLIWLDPEADYDLKVIRVDPTTQIEYTGPKGDAKISTKIKTFVKNQAIFRIKEGPVKEITHIVKTGETLASIAEMYKTTETYISEINKIKLNKLTPGELIKVKTTVGEFDIEVKKNGSVIEKLKGVTEYILENWNYENNKVELTNFYNIKITRNGEELFDELYTVLGLPSFGISRTYTVDPDSILDTAVTEDTTIPLYNLKVENPDSANGLVINPDAISNDFLAKAELFSKGIYGPGTPENPQHVEIIKRFARTDLDTASYYIIEGVLVDKNKKEENDNSTVPGADDKRWYRLAHAIGAIIPFIKLLTELASKLFPTIEKTIKMFKDPTGFITDIIMEKIKESFSMFSDVSLERFKKTIDIVVKKPQIVKEGNLTKYANQISKNFKTSPLRNYVYVEEISNIDAGKFDFILDGTAMFDFSILGNSIEFGLELKMSNLIPEVPNINVPKIPTVDLPKVTPPNVDASGSASASVGKDGKVTGNFTGSVNVTPPKVETPNIQIPNIGIPSITLPKVKSPFRFIKGKFKKAKFKDCGNKDQKDNSGKSNSDLLNDLANQQEDKNANKKSGQGTTTIESTWYSTGEYINGVDYTYYYINEDTADVLKEVDELVKPGSTNKLMVPSNEPGNDKPEEALPEDIQLAQDKIENALNKDPDNELLKAKLKEIKEKLLKSMSKVQPILKLLLGIISTPIRIISCIIQWILDFFKSLMNPMELPSKIIEFLSFKWIMDFFSADFLMKTFGLALNPSITVDWATAVNIPNPNIDIKCGKLGDKLKSKLDELGGKIPKIDTKIPKVELPKVELPKVELPKVELPKVELPKVELPKVELPKVDVKISTDKITGQITSKLDSKVNTEGIKANLSVNIDKKSIDVKLPKSLQDLVKNIKPHCGTFAIPDLPIIKLPDFLSLPFMPRLPEYTPSDYRINPKMSIAFSDSILCLIEKFINALIDLIWSILGIEAILPPPHIILCKKKNANETNKLKDGDTEKDNKGTEIESTIPFKSNNLNDYFVYEVVFEDGTKETIKDYESLQKFMDENKDINFDLQV